MVRKLVSINTFNNGSTGRIMRYIDEFAEKSDYLTFRAYARGDMKIVDCNKDILIGNNRDIYYHALYAKTTNRNGFGSLGATKKLIRRLETIRPDIIHLHNLHGYYLNIDSLFGYLKNCGVPVIWTLHDCWALTGHCGHFSEIGCDRWKTGCGSCPQIHTSGSRGLIDTSAENYGSKKRIFTSLPYEQLHVVTPSKWLADIVSQSYLGKYSCKVINNGIDTSIFKPTDCSLRKKYGLEGKKIILGVASGWDEKKGFDDFQELSYHIGEDKKIVLVGLEKKQIRGLQNGIIGLPRVDSLSDLAQWYSAADVYVNLSKEETMGLTTIEALSCGTPAIVLNKTALPEFVDNSRTGFVMPLNFDEINNLIDSLESKDQISNECVAWGNRYTNELMGKKYLSLYNALV